MGIRPLAYVLGTFLRKNKSATSKSTPIEIKKSNEEILEEKVEEYYKVFISQDEKFMAKINFINKFGDKLHFQVNVKKILED